MPFIAKWPGKIKADAVDDASLISAVDLLPTFCQIAGARLPEGYKPDGISQLDALLGKNMTEQRTKPLFWKIRASWPAKDRAPDHWVAYAVVYEKWKLVSNEDLSYVELYDIVKDTYEKNDLKTQNPRVVKKMVGMIDDWKTDLPEKPSSDCFSKTRKS